MLESAYRRLGSNYFPQNTGDIRIEGTTYINTGGDSTLRPTNTKTDRMYGQADITFVPD